MKAAGVTITKDRVAAVLVAIRAIPNQEVLVGIPDDNGAGQMGPHTGSNRRQQSGEINNAALGYIHEHGAPEANIPPRPFLVPGILDAKDQIASYFKQAGEYALKANAAGVSRALNAAGMVASNAVKRKITTGPFEPLKPATIRARQRRSVGSSYRRKASSSNDVTPLVDTGQLRNSITYVVRKTK